MKSVFTLRERCIFTCSSSGREEFNDLIYEYKKWFLQDEKLIRVILKLVYKDLNCLNCLKEI